jgi:hypothetical protein
MSVDFDFSICRVCFAPDCVATLSSLFEESAVNAEKFQNYGNRCEFLASNVIEIVFKSFAYFTDFRRQWEARSNDL